ncbi:MAG TPA: DUF2911 domain-containing protein [Lacibacter sp.]|nr:DUF2911 domain-containing protein [Lacibacter sp.]HMO88972.1 DUF2911 domain-containing protein [Lacibacter sp.]HMP88325.1 DUF2911 domain-containing protein [Lacibacter sp.]
MKKLVALLPVAFLLAFTACAQNDPSKRPSPPQETKMTVGSATITINYGAPSVKGREIWGKLVPYGQVWRTGANEATIFETSADVKVEGQLLPKGKYGLFTIPGKDEWVIIFNKNAAQWGSYSYKEADDILRVKVRPGMAAAFQEQMKFEGHVDGSISLLWEKLEIIFSVSQ